MRAPLETRRLDDAPPIGGGRRLAAAVGALLLVKLALVSGSAIVTWGMDDISFARPAVHGYWGSPYTRFAYVRQPIYPLFLAAHALVGLPVRVGVEGAWAAACWTIARAMQVADVRRGVPLAVAALSMFHPWTLIYFDHLLQDTLYAPLLIAFLAATAIGLIETSRRALWCWGAAAALCGALAANTRPEPELVHASIAAAGFIAVVQRLRRRADRSLAARRLACIVLGPALAVLAATHAIKAANSRTIGVYATSDLAPRGFTSLYRELAAIPPATHRPSVPLARDVRERAYAASPTFAMLRPWLDGDQRPENLLIAGRLSTGVEDEYGGWAAWAIRYAAWESRPRGWASAGELDAMYGAAAGELREASDAGKLGRRWVPLAFVPPEWGPITRAMPGAVVRCWSMIARPSYERQHSRDLGRGVERLFDEAAVRGKGWCTAGAAWTERLEGLKRGLAGPVRVAMAAASWLALAAPLVGVIGRRRRVLAPGWVVLAAVLWTALAARVALVALLDVTGLPALDRYLLACPVLVLALAAMAAQAIMLIIGARARRRA